MRKQFLALTMLCLSTLGMAQTDKQETSYRRSSLYTLMLPKGLDQEKLAAVQSAFLENAFPDKYNDHNLSERVLNEFTINDISVSQEEIEAAQPVVRARQASWRASLAEPPQPPHRYQSLTTRRWQPSC